PIGLDPEPAAIGIVPSQAMAGTAIVLGPERNLAMADGFAVHVGLEYAFHRRVGRIVHRGAIGAAPDKAVAHRHAAAVFALGNDGFQHLALAIHEPGAFGTAVMTLLLDPEAAPSRIGGDGVGPGRRRQE